MALTVTQRSRNAAGGRWEVVTDVAADTSYPAGGWPLTKAQLGIPLLTDNVTVGNSGGYALVYDYTNEKLMAFRQTAATGALVEVPDTTNIGAAVGTVRVKATGR